MVFTRAQQVIGILLMLVTCQLSAQPGQSAPAFSLPRLDNQQVLSLANLRGQVVYVDFWAPWCAPCRAMAPAYAQAAGVLEPDVRLAKVNTEDVGSLAARFRIQGIPTMILFLHGRELARQSGAMPAQAIVQWVRQHLPLSPA